jgi:predicted Zn-dependent protease
MITGNRSGESQSMFVDAGGQVLRRSASGGDLSSTARVASEPAAGQAPGQIASPALNVLNALRGAAADPEATVRAMAVRALGASGDPTVAPSLTARLVDTSRIVRVAAAEALLRLEVVALPGAAGVALARAQDEYAASLRVFGDNAGDHVALGWLEMQRNRGNEARAAFEHALALDPGLLQPRVFLGVLAAREGRYADAIREWEAVKARSPSWPNINRLIEEARKRAGEN